MSLLMDALKKAEHEKKKAADEAAAASSHRADAGAGVVPPRLTDADLVQAFERHTRETAEVAGPAVPSESVAELPAGPAPGDGSDPRLQDIGDPAATALTLEPLPPETAERDEPRIDPVPTRDDTDQPGAGFGAAPSPEPKRTSVERPQEIGADSGAGGATPFDKDATLPSERRIRSSFSDYLDAPRSTDRSRGEGSGKRSFYPGDSTTRVAADTVFAATRRSSLSRSLRLGIAAIVILGISLGAISLYYELSTPVAVDVGAPMAAMPLPSPSSASNNAVPEPDPAPAEPHPDPPTLATAAATVDAVAPAKPQSFEAVSTALSRPDAATSSTVPAQPPSRSDAKGAGGRASTETGGHLPSEPSSSSTAEPRGVKITRSVAKDLDIHQITEAYQAFHAGDLQKAESLYGAVLKQHPERRDALLGLAAVAVRHGRTDQAYRYYRRLLQLDPRDSVAAAAIFNLQGDAGSDVSESRLKLLLDQKPKAPDVYFSLGNRYARQGRWAEAQQAYFDAYTSDDRNPDYVFNLAVSLDRLGQIKAALTYYREALDLADRQPVSFNTSQLLARIQTLSTVAH